MHFGAFWSLIKAVAAFLGDFDLFYGLNGLNNSALMRDPLCMIQTEFTMVLPQVAVKVLKATLALII